LVIGDHLRKALVWKIRRPRNSGVSQKESKREESHF
jgi:hypothetical protein